MEFGGKFVEFKLDTGSEANIIPRQIYDNLSMRGKLEETNEVLSSYGNHRVVPVGKVSLSCTVKARTLSLDFYVVDLESVSILGLEACTRFNLVKKINSLTARLSSKEAILCDYKDVFGCMPKEYHIEIQQDATPVVHPPRKVPFSLHGKLKETLDRLEKSGDITKVDQPTDWVNNLVIAGKKDGSLRLCLDPRDLNKVIKCEHYKIPTADEVTSKLAGKKVFSILGEKDGFWQIPLDQESSFLCTFNSPFGRYRFLMCPFGISSAPEVFQKRNDQLFGDIEGVNVVFDDLFICGKDGIEHDGILKQVLIVPEGMRKEMLALLHGSHQGMEKSKARAREVMYWPGMSRDIEDTITRCNKCSEWRRNNRKEPLISHEVPGRPWRKLGADIFEFR